MTAQMFQLLPGFLLAAWTTALPVIAQEQPELIVQVDRQQIYLGESIVYNVTVNHVENPSAPTLQGFDEYHVESVGQQSLNSQQVTIINGRRSEIIRRGMLFQYRLTPRSAGEMTIPSPTATIDGEVIKGRSIPISVVAPDEQDTVILEVSTDRTTVFPLQTFTVTLKLLVRELPGDLSSRSPLSVQAEQPVHLTAPWLDDESLPANIGPLQSWRAILEPLASGSGRGRSDGLQINEIGSQSAFSFFGGNRKAVFLPPSHTTVRQVDDGTDAGYREYTLQRSFESQTPGNYTLPACNIKGTFATGFAGRNLDGTQIYAVSDPVAVTVKSVPTEGRPPTYIGGIGKFEISSDIAPRSAAVGDPITLSVTVFGNGTVKDLRAPDIGIINGVADQFRVYEATEETVSNGKTFTWSLRPLLDSVTEFPAIPMSYFDVEQETYVSTQSAAVPLTINEASQLDTSDIVSSPDSQSSDSVNSLELNDAGLFANHSDLKTLRGSSIHIGSWLPKWAAMIIGYLLISISVRWRQRINADPSISRKRTALRRAHNALSSALTDTDSGVSVLPDSLSRIVAGLIADFTNHTQVGITSSDAEALLTHIGVQSDLRHRVVAFMTECDAARYGAIQEDCSSLASECRDLLNELNRELTRQC